MAIKKIGALIALEGEKEFKQNVTNCNKSLSALKSELGLVQAQYEGQENTLEALQKKHEVLSKSLDEQKSKEEAVRKGLEHAKESYDKVGAGLTNLNKQQETHSKKLEDLKQDYEKATDRLDKMTKSGNSSEQAIKKQEAVVQSLAGELKKEETALDDVNLAIAKGEKNYQTAGNRVKDWETKLNTAEAQVIKASSAVNKNAAFLKEAAQSTDQCAKSIDGFGKEVKKAEKVTMDLTTVLQSNLANTLVNLGKDAVVNAVKSVTSLETAQRQLQASTGATTGEMQQYKSVMEDLHNNNYGDDINDVAQSMALVKQYTGELDPNKLESMTENGIAMRDVFDMDLSETIRGVDALVKNMGLTSDEAFDLMAKGAQNGLDKSGELSDNIAEYSQLWGQAGFSAQEMFGILDNGLKSGAYNLDKVNDFVKEFTISLADGRIEENLTSFSGGTQSLFYQWKSGKATAKDVFYSVIQDLNSATNQQEALTLASNTWSALGEDNAMKVIASLAETNTAYDNVKGTMESIKDIKYDTLESRFTQLGKKFQTQVGVPIAEDVLPAIEDGLDAVIENMDSLVPAIGGVIASVGTFKATMKLATVAQAAFNMTVSATPIALIATATVGAATAIGIYAESAGEASEEVRLLAERNQQLYDSANEVSESAQDLVESYSNNTAEMEAQSKYAQILKEKIENLSETKGNDNEKTEVMRQYIAELNQLVPGLNLAYDEQTDSLTKNSDAIQEYLDNKQKEIELQAEEEHALELIKKRSELKMEAIKLEEEEKGIKAELGTLLEGENEWYLKNCRSVLTLVDGKNEERRSYDALTEAQEKNSEALDKNKSSQELIEEDIKETQDRLQELGSSWEEATATQDENTESTNANAEAQQAAADANATAAQTIVETYMGMQETVSSVLESQMNMFDEFDAGTKISSEKLLENMESQINGVTNWADNMALLADRGVNQGILDKLAEMGPQGTTYVEAFANMTDEQLQQANDMWSQSLDMKEGVNASVQGMIEEYTAALNGGKEHMVEVMSTTGIDVSAGFGSGIRSGIEQGKIAVDELGKATIVQAKTTLDSHSPSKVFMGIGNDVVSGLAGGINNSQSQATIAVQMLSQQLVTISSNILNASDFSGIGQVIPNGIRSGVESASPALIGKVSSMCTNILDKVNDKITHERFRATGMEVPGGLISGMDSGINGVHNAAESLVDAVTNEASSLNSWTLYMDGYNTAIGLANGISAGESEVINAVAQMCADAVAEAEYQLDINSPSKVFMKLGSYTAEGFGIGYEKEMQNVNAVIADSMAIPDVNSSTMTAGGGVSAQGSAFADAINLLQEYLPYLANIANKEVSLYPSKRQFESEVAQAADKGMEVIRKRAERR